MNYSQFETIQKIKKSADAIRKEEKELAKREKALAEKQLQVQRLGLNENVEAPTVRASAEAVNSMRAKIAEMKAKHNKFAQETASDWSCSPSSFPLAVSRRVALRKFLY